MLFSINASNSKASRPAHNHLTMDESYVHFFSYYTLHLLNTQYSVRCQRLGLTQFDTKGHIYKISKFTLKFLQIKSIIRLREFICNMERNENWVLCPECTNKTRIQIRQDTEIKKLPLFCPKCKKKTLINIRELETTVIKEPDA